MSTPSSQPPETQPAPVKPSKGPSGLAIGLLAGIISGILSGVMCTVICLLLLFVVLPVSRSVSPGTVTEEGSVEVAIVGQTMKGESQVFYKNPFATPPQLTMVENYDYCVITEQKADSFKVSRDVTGRGGWSSVGTLKWKAEGAPAN